LARTIVATATVTLLDKVPPPPPIQVPGVEWRRPVPHVEATLAELRTELALRGADPTIDEHLGLLVDRLVGSGLAPEDIERRLNLNQNGLRLGANLADLANPDAAWREQRSQDKRFEAEYYSQARLRLAIIPDRPLPGVVHHSAARGRCHAPVVTVCSAAQT
jgi:hypothetical protein